MSARRWFSPDELEAMQVAWQIRGVPSAVADPRAAAHREPVSGRGGMHAHVRRDPAASPVPEQVSDTARPTGDDPEEEPGW